MIQFSREIQDYNMWSSVSISLSLLVKSCPMCIRLNKLAQVKLSSATLKTNICGTQTLVKYQHYHHHQHHHYHQHQYSQQYQQLTPQLESPLNCSATRLQFLAWLRSYFCFYFLSWSFAFCAQLVIYHQKLDITCLNLQIL